jgi:two-component system C4-dicarboxylate transport sensor histidine kinase DctB
VSSASRLRSVFVSLGVLLACVLVLLGAAYSAQRIALMNLRLAGGERLSLYTAYLNSELDKMDLLSRLVCRTPAVTDLLLAPNDRMREQVDRAIEQFSEASGAPSIYVMDRNGTVISSSDWRHAGSLVGETLAAHPYWQLALRDEAANFVALGSITGKPAYYASCPVRAEGKRVGNAIVRLATDDLTRAWRHDGGARLLIADRNGVVFLSTQEQWVLHALRPLSGAQRAEVRASRQYLDRPLPAFTMRPIWRISDDAIVAAFPDSDRSGAEAETYVLVQTQTLPDAGWTVYVLSDLHSVEHWVLVGISIAGLLLSLAVLLGFYFYRRRQHLRQLVAQSIRDPLTHLYTRLYMQDAVAGLEAWQDREPAMAVALALFDVDHFKQVNDTHGHRVGDDVLRAIGQVILDEAREGDIPVRYGGEELAVFLRVHDIQEAVSFAERVRAHVRRLRFVRPRGGLRVTVSAGVTLRAPGEALESFIERGDRRLYEAKRAGRDCVRFDGPTIEGAVK